MIDLNEYRVCVDDHSGTVYLYHQNGYCHTWIAPESAATMGDLMEAIYDHIKEHHS